MHNKIHDIESLLAELAHHREAHPGCRVVFTNGCFDLLHVGHVRYLWAARRLGDLLVVAINDDDSVRRLKGADRPVLKIHERLEIVAGLACVDYVTHFAEDTPLALIEQVRPEVLVKGGNYALDDVVGRAAVEGWGGEVRVLRPTDGQSSTQLIQRVRAVQGSRS